MNTDKLDVLIINSYAGSLTIGASAVGLPIRGSYEDAGFGLSVQMANFPKLEFRPTVHDWPDKQDLRRTIVLAHPPCSAFSRQTPKGRTGVDSNAFACTKRVLSYSMGNGALAIAVESVQPALAGAKHVHESYARRHGYHLYRVLQNAVSFGVPQWRPRFWAVFMREGAAPQAMRWALPKAKGFVTVADVLEDGEPDDPPRYLVPQWEKMLAKLEKNGHPRREILHLARTESGHLHRVLQRKFYPEFDFYQLKELFTARGAFSTRLPRFLPPDGVAPALMSDSMWLYKGRLVGNNEYKALMGFPRDYLFPPHDLGELKKYLSKGVCPPVAEWVLRSIINHLENVVEHHGTSARLEPGETADFNLKRKDVCIQPEAA